MCSREVHIGQDIGFSLIHESGELRQLGAQLVRHPAPLCLGRRGIVLGEGGGDEGCGHATSLLSGMRQQVSHRMHSAALPCGVQHPGNRRLQPLMGIRDHQFHAAQATAGQFAQEVEPEGFSLEQPMSMPSTSRLPSLLTPTAMVTALATMRPASRTFT